MPHAESLSVTLADAANHTAARNAEMVQWLKLGGLGVLVLVIAVGLLWVVRILTRPKTAPCVACGSRCRSDAMYSATINGATGRFCHSCFREIDKRVSEKAVDRLIPRERSTTLH